MHPALDRISTLVGVNARHVLRGQLVDELTEGLADGLDSEGLGEVNSQRSVHATGSNRSSGLRSSARASRSRSPRCISVLPRSRRDTHMSLTPALAARSVVLRFRLAISTLMRSLTRSASASLMTNIL